MDEYADYMNNKEFKLSKDEIIRFQHEALMQLLDDNIKKNENKIKYFDEPKYERSREDLLDYYQRQVEINKIRKINLKILIKEV